MLLQMYAIKVGNEYLSSNLEDGHIKFIPCNEEDAFVGALFTTKEQAIDMRDVIMEVTNLEARVVSWGVEEKLLRPLSREDIHGTPKKKIVVVNSCDNCPHNVEGEIVPDYCDILDQVIDCPESIIPSCKLKDYMGE